MKDNLRKSYDANRKIRKCWGDISPVTKIFSSKDRKELAAEEQLKEYKEDIDDEYAVHRVFA